MKRMMARLFADAGEAEKLLLLRSDPPRRIDLLVTHAVATLPDGHLKEQVTLYSRASMPAA